MSARTTRPSDVPDHLRLRIVGVVANTASHVVGDREPRVANGQQVLKRALVSSALPNPGRTMRSVHSRPR